MPILQDAAELIALALDRIPATVLVIALLAGPTLAYLLWLGLGYHRSGGGGEQVVIPITAEFWQCRECLSLTPVAQDECYRCGAPPEGWGDEEEVQDPAAATPGVPVMAPLGDAAVDEGPALAPTAEPALEPAPVGRRRSRTAPPAAESAPKRTTRTSTSTAAPRRTRRTTPKG